MNNKLIVGLAVFIVGLVTSHGGLILYDDFSGTELDGDLWTTSSTSAGGAGVTVDDGWMLMETPGTRRDRLRTKEYFQPEHTVDMLIARPGEHMRYRSKIYFGTEQADYAYHITWDDDGMMRARTAVDGWASPHGTSPVLATGTTYRLVIETAPLQSSINLFLGETLIWDVSFGNPGSTADARLEFQNYSLNTDATVENPLTFAINEITIIPEPGAASLVLLGLWMAWIGRRRLLRG